MSTAPTETLSLAGPWTVSLDNQRRSVPVTLPGSLDRQCIGFPVTIDTAWTGTIFDRSYFDAPAYAPYREPDNLKIPFWLQPTTRFVGVARYEREFTLPPDWTGQPLRLHLERPHGTTRVWIDDRDLGRADSLSVPHEYTLPADLAAGSHRLVVAVDNRLNIDVGENAHSVSDHTQGNWNGIIGRLELRPVTADLIDRLDVTPHVATGTITVSGHLRAPTTAPSVRLQIIAPDGRRHDAVDAPLDGLAFSARIELGPDASRWSEFNPSVFQLLASVDATERTTSFGLRELTVEGTQFLLNGQPTFLRGTLDCAIFPDTGHPPTDVESWRVILGRIKACGLNHVRFHSWCPPEAAFTAGDELGLYFQVECAVWPNAVAVLAFNSPAGIGDGTPVDDWAIAEGERILRAYGNHPCFVLLACGNEPGGPHHQAYLRRWLNHFRALDPRRRYTGSAGWPELEENEFHVIPHPRIHQWGDGLNCRINGQPPATTHDYREIVAARDRPIISHEIGQWCAYPSLGDVPRYRGHLQPRNYKIFAASLAAHHLGDQAGAFTHASGKLQAICYKEEIESSLRTPGLGGFQLLGLQDFPGQGTAPVGLLNAFWEEKGYIDAAAIRRFCAPTVPLARLSKRVFSTAESLTAELEIVHHGAAPLPDTATTWALVNDHGIELAQGTLPARDVPLGGPTKLGTITVDLSALAAPARLRLVVRIADAKNDWDLWVYPASRPEPLPENVLLTRSLNDALAALAEGRRVVWNPTRESLPDDVALGFSPIFWNTACTQGQAPHTLGLLCDPTHPLFAHFPTDAHSNWQWWYLITRAAPLNLDHLPAALRPLVQVIDDWFTNRRLGLVFETRVGAGRLLVTSIDVMATPDDPDQTLVVGQFRRSLLDYAASDAFAPSPTIPPDDLRRLTR